MWRVILLLTGFWRSPNRRLGQEMTGLACALFPNLFFVGNYDIKTGLSGGTHAKAGQYLDRYISFYDWTCASFCCFLRCAEVRAEPIDSETLQGMGDRPRGTPPTVGDRWGRRFRIRNQCRRERTGQKRRHRNQRPSRAKPAAVQVTDEAKPPRGSALRPPQESSTPGKR